MARIAITGSSGLLGTALRESLAADGHEVLRVRRGNESDPSALWNPAAAWFRPGALDGVDAVVHLAGESIGSGRWTAAKKRLIVSSRVEGTRLLVDHLATLERKPAVLVSASAVGIYGSRGDEALTEQSAPGTGFLVDVVKGWEAEALRAKESGIRVVLPRFSLILSKDGGALPRMLTPFKLGVGGKLAGGDQWMAWTSLADAVGVIRYAIESPSLEGAVNATGHPVRNKDFTKALGAVLGRPTVIPLPGFALKAMFGGEMVEELLLASQRVESDHLRASGYTFEYPDIGPALEAALA